MNLQNKNVLITGASGGIGQALSLQLAEAGAFLWLVGRNREALEKLYAQLPHRERHKVILMNRYSDEEIYHLAESFQAGVRLDVLINNAGSSCFALFDKQSFSDIREQIHTNVELPMLLTRALCKQFREGGVILNIGSVLGEIGHPGYSVYSATKASIHRFSEALGREVAPLGLSVLYVAPRATRTRLNSDAAYAMNNALGNRCDTPETVARHVIAALAQNTLRSRIGLAERLFVKINALFPSIVDRALSKKLPTIMRHLRSPVKGSLK